MMIEMAIKCHYNQINPFFRAPLLELSNCCGLQSIVVFCLNKNRLIHYPQEGAISKPTY